nr:heme ABC transporter substrate-binding protein IsdE [Alkalihalobacillus trypoxylicola]
MLKRMLLLTSLLIIHLSLIGCSEEDTIPNNTEVSSKSETVHEIDERIISTTVAATEIFAALEIDLIGVPTSYKELPERYQGVEEVGNPMSPDMELMKVLNPTDVYSVTTLETDLKEPFERIDLEATFLDFQSLDSMLAEIVQIGDKYDRKNQADQIVDSIQYKLEEIEKEIEHYDSPSVLILLGVPGSYLVATEHSYIGDLVKRAGGVNIVEGESVEYLASNTEYLQQSNPNVILRAAHGMPEEVVEMFDEKFATDDIWQHFDAVKNERVYDLDEQLFPTTGNLAVVEAMEQLVSMLYKGND